MYLKSKPPSTPFSTQQKYYTEDDYPQTHKLPRQQKIKTTPSYQTRVTLTTTRRGQKLRRYQTQMRSRKATPFKDLHRSAKHPISPIFPMLVTLASALRMQKMSLCGIAGVCQTCQTPRTKTAILSSLKTTPASSQPSTKIRLTCHTTQTQMTRITTRVR